MMCVCVCVYFVYFVYFVKDGVITRFDPYSKVLYNLNIQPVLFLIFSLKSGLQFPPILDPKLRGPLRKDHARHQPVPSSTVSLPLD